MLGRGRAIVAAAVVSGVAIADTATLWVGRRWLCFFVSVVPIAIAVVDTL